MGRDGGESAVKPGESAWVGGRAGTIDLDGDGHAVLLISGDTVFTWYPSEARDGHGSPSRVAQAASEDKGLWLPFPFPRSLEINGNGTNREQRAWSDRALRAPLHLRQGEQFDPSWSAC